MRTCGGVTVDARMIFMNNKKREYFVWLVVGLIFLGGFIGTGVSAGQAGVIARPQIDLQRPETTEIALFALG